MTNTLQVQLHSPLILAWGNITPYLGHQTSLLHHKAHPTSWGHHSRLCPCLDSWLGLLGIPARPEDIWQQMLVIPTCVAEKNYVPPLTTVSYSIFVFSSLKISKVTFTLIPLPDCTGQLLSPDALIMVDCWELWLLLQSELPSQKRVNHQTCL